jgi:tRNA(Arg) A34 adenosine deaminase TadA
MDQQFRAPVPDDEHAMRRRVLLRRAGLAAAAGALAPVVATPAAASSGCPAPVPIAQPRRRTPRAFMNRAEALRDKAVAAGDQAYGAVVVKRDRIVGLGPSRVVTNDDPTAHAEMEAMRDAIRRIAGGDLGGCVLYATSQPCAMCETAASFAGVERLVVGHGLVDGGPPRYGGR